MSRTRHRLVASIGAAAVAVLLAAGCSSSTKVGGGTTVASTVPGGSSTSVAPATTAAPTTAATSAPTTAGPGPTAPASAAVLGAPTNLQATPSGGITLAGGFLCGDDPSIPGWVVDDCQQMPSFGDGLTSLVLHSAADGRLAVAVLFRSGATLVQRYGAAESGPGVWSAVTVQVGDFHFDDAAEVWIGYRYDGTGQYLDFDVLDPRPDGSVFLGGLQGLDHGVVRVHPGGASVQSAVYAASDPGCCPSTMLQREVTFSADQWWIDAGASYPAAATPPLTGNL